MGIFHNSVPGHVSNTGLASRSAGTISTSASLPILIALYACALNCGMHLLYGFHHLHSFNYLTVPLELSSDP